MLTIENVEGGSVDISALCDEIKEKLETVINQVQPLIDQNKDKIATTLDNPTSYDDFIKNAARPGVDAGQLLYEVKSLGTDDYLKKFQETVNQKLDVLKNSESVLNALS